MVEVCEICGSTYKVYPSPIKIGDSKVTLNTCWDCDEEPWQENPSQEVLGAVVAKLPDMPLREIKLALCQLACGSSRQQSQCLYSGCPYMLDEERPKAKARYQTRWGD